MNIQDFIKAVECKKEIGKKESVYWDCFAYNVAFPDTFDNPIVRQARGIVISKDRRGNYDRILRWPFEKFFNLNEREETQYNLLKDAEIDYVMEKVDGTMMCPFIDPLTDEVVYGTKRVDENFHEHIEFVLHVHFPFVKDGIEHILRNTRWSPIFEFHDPDYDPSVIVVKYKRRRVTLLAMRDLETGEYAPRNVLESYAYQCGFELPGFFDERDIGVIVKSLEGAEDFEGVVVVFKDGMRVKIKCDWYVRRHKIKELFNRRHIMAQLIFECGDVSFDDIAPYIEESDRLEFEDFSMELHKTINKVIFWIKSTASHFETKKDFALSEFGKLPFASLVFRLIEDDSLDPFVLVVNDLKKNINKEINFDRWIERVRSLP